MKNYTGGAIYLARRPQVGNRLRDLILQIIWKPTSIIVLLVTQNTSKFLTTWPHQKLSSKHLPIYDVDLLQILLKKVTTFPTHFEFVLRQLNQ